MIAHRRYIGLFAAALAAMGTAAGESGTSESDTQRKINQLERQVATLRESYTLARSDADEARRQLREIRSRLEAMGGAALGEGEQKLIETASQLEAARNELDTLRQSSLRLTSALSAYMRTALVDDADARQALEAALVELDVALGLRQAKQDELSGTVNDATVLSIDSESGLIVINAGSRAGVQVGLPMEITRGDQAIAVAVVTDVRKSVSGLLVQKHLNPALSVSAGDRVSVTTND
ncbi:MAG: hypothetical protein IJE66_06785 [Akkermansia sp.]|nr:hypothetical protein [Akkermansia sp.]